LTYFPYGQREIEYLSLADKRLGQAINLIGPIQRPLTGDPFAALVSSIISQQISGKAAASVWQRLNTLCGTITPAGLGKLSVDDIQSCGMSKRKAEYIRGITEAALLGAVDFEVLKDLPDEEITARLTALRGVGPWTAEMVLIFSLARPDVVSWADYGIRKGMCLLYGLEELAREDFNTYRARYSPYGSVASLYLWEIAGNPTVIQELK
jgi:DNA-3-methyladenine glycosylase II